MAWAKCSKGIQCYGIDDVFFHCLPEALSGECLLNRFCDDLTTFDRVLNPRLFRRLRTHLKFGELPNVVLSQSAHSVLEVSSWCFLQRRIVGETKGRSVMQPFERRNELQPSYHGLCLSSVTGRSKALRSDQSKKTIRAAIELNIISRVCLGISFVEGPGDPRVKRVIARPIRNIRNPGQQL